MPNSVSVLIEAEQLDERGRLMRDTGIVMVGIRVVRQFWRNRNILEWPRPIASRKRSHDFLIDSDTTVVVSNASSAFSGRKRFDGRPRRRHCCRH
jgi:hypothetical protein